MASSEVFLRSIRTVSVIHKIELVDQLEESDPKETPQETFGNPDVPASECTDIFS